MIVFYILRRVVSAILRIYELMFIVSAILSWFPDIENETIIKLQEVLLKFIEPITEPVRRFLFRFEWVRSCPIDISFSVAFLLIIFLEVVI